LRKFNSRLGGKIAMHKMERAASLQIDEPGDFELIEQLLRYRQTTGLQDHGTTGPQEQAQRAEGGNRKPEEMTEGGNVKPEERGQWSVVSGQSSAANGQWSRIKLLVLDFDGVLTDNRVLVSEDGKESVLCDRGDGLGIGMLKAAGIQVIVISKERNPVVAARCRKLGIECIQGCDDKLEALKKRAAGGKLKAEIGDQKTAVSGQWSVVSGLKSDQIAYVGNDINDLECMRWVGLPIAVANAVPEVLAAARCVTRRPGGHGAIREVVECLLRSRKQTCR
jgi:3-deoxy-D-manno-octulosonate 8-phosphate phosphatase KdsC-like HAD superfamily phosphatase